MLVALIALAAALAGPQAPSQQAGSQQTQSLGVAEGLRTLPQTAAPAQARAPTEAASETEPSAEPASPRVVCRMVQVTGTRFPIRQCRNAQETDADRAEAREMLRRMQGSRTEPVG